MTAVQAALEFRRLTEEAVYGALSDIDADNPIAAEISRLIAAYTQSFQRLAMQPGGLHPAALLVKGTCPIEEIARQLVLQEIAAEAVAQGRGQH